MFATYFFLTIGKICTCFASDPGLRLIFGAILNDEVRLAERCWRRGKQTANTNSYIHHQKENTHIAPEITPCLKESVRYVQSTPGRGELGFEFDAAQFAVSSAWHKHSSGARREDQPRGLCAAPPGGHTRAAPALERNAQPFSTHKPAANGNSIKNALSWFPQSRVPAKSHVAWSQFKCKQKGNGFCAWRSCHRRSFFGGVHAALSF